MGNIADELLSGETEATGDVLRAARWLETVDESPGPIEGTLLPMELVEQFEGLAGIGTVLTEERVLQITFSDGIVPLDLDLDYRKVEIAARMLKRIQELREQAVEALAGIEEAP